MMKYAPLVLFARVADRSTQVNLIWRPSQKRRTGYCNASGMLAKPQNALTHRAVICLFLTVCFLRSCEVIESDGLQMRYFVPLAYVVQLCCAFAFLPAHCNVANDAAHSLLHLTDDLDIASVCSSFRRSRGSSSSSCERYYTYESSILVAALGIVALMMMIR